MHRPLRPGSPRIVAAALVLGSVLAAVAALSLARATADPAYDEARRAPASARPGGEDAIEPPRVSKLVPTVPPASSSLPLVTLTPRSLLLGDTRVTGAPDLASLGESGFGGKDKREPGALQIVPLFDMLEAAHSSRSPPSPPVEIEPELPRDGLRLLLFENAPYRALIELLYTAGQANFSHIFLIARGPGQRGIDGAIEWSPSWYNGPHRGYPGEGMTVDVLLLPSGIALRTDRGAVGPGCGEGDGLSLPGIAKENIFSELRGCIRKLRQARPEATEPQVTLGAHPSTPVHLVYDAILALRWPGEIEGPSSGPGLTLPVSPTSVQAWQSPREPSRRPERRPNGQGLDALSRLGAGSLTPAPSAAKAPKSKK